MPVSFTTDAARNAVKAGRATEEVAKKVENIAETAVEAAKIVASLGSSVDVFDMVGASSAVKELSLITGARELFNEVFGEMLSNVSDAFKAAVEVARARTAAAPVVKPLVDGELVISHLPGDVRPLMEQAIDGMFGATNGRINGNINNTYLSEAIYLYTVLGLSRDEIATRLHDKLTQHFVNIEQLGMAPTPDFGALLQKEPLVSRPPYQTTTDIREKYGFARIARLMDAAGMRPGYEPNLGLVSDMAEAYGLAVRYGLGDDANQCLANTVRRCGFADAAWAIEGVKGGDVPMLNVGAAAFEQYLHASSAGKHNTAFDVIEALKRVQGGELKPIAAAMLVDLAKALFATGDESGRELAFKALRGAGAVIDRKKLGGDRSVDLITVVTDKDAHDTIVALARASLAEDGPWVYRQETFAALEACGAYEVIGEYASAMLARLDEAGGWPANVGEPQRSSARYQQAAKLFGRAFDGHGLDALASKAASTDSQKNNIELQNIIAGCRKTIARGPQKPTVNPNALVQRDPTAYYASGLKSIETDVHRELEQAVQLFPAQRDALRKEGNGFLQQDLFGHAQRKFIEAADRTGLLRVCDAMIKAYDGLNAQRGLLAAAMLAS